jgi:hypothetical protein
MPSPYWLCECCLHCIKTTSFGKIHSHVSRVLMASKQGKFIYSCLGSRETIEALMNPSSCSLIHFVVTPRSFPKIKTLSVLACLNSRNRSCMFNKMKEGRVGFCIYSFIWPRYCSMVLPFVVPSRTSGDVVHRHAPFLSFK